MGILSGNYSVYEHMHIHTHTNRQAHTCSHKEIKRENITYFQETDFRKGVERTKPINQNLYYSKEHFICVSKSTTRTMVTC